MSILVKKKKHFYCATSDFFFNFCFLHNFFSFYVEYRLRTGCFGNRICGQLSSFRTLLFVGNFRLLQLKPDQLNQPYTHIHAVAERFQYFFRKGIDYISHMSSIYPLNVKYLFERCICRFFTRKTHLSNAQHHNNKVTSLENMARITHCILPLNLNVRHYLCETMT